MGHGCEGCDGEGASCPYADPRECEERRGWEVGNAEAGMLMFLETLAARHLPQAGLGERCSNSDVELAEMILEALREMEWWEAPRSEWDNPNPPEEDMSARAIVC